MKENLQFTALLDILSRQDLITEYSEDCKDITPSHITINSKDVVPGTFFVCKGASFKEDYLKSAIAQGAIVYLSQQKYDDVDIPYIIVNDIRKAMALAARWFFGNPGDNDQGRNHRNKGKDHSYICHEGYTGQIHRQQMLSILNP